MSRPRQPSDPSQWPEPCGRCGEHHKIVATWPDARICGYCYQAAKRSQGLCRCGHHGVLPGRIDGQPACRGCTGVRLNVDCRTCGSEAELYSGGQCWQCVLAVTVDRLLTNPHTGVMAAPLRPVADALKAMDRVNSGLTWIRQKHVTALLRDLAIGSTIAHESLDALPNTATREYVRGLLVEHKALPRRDDNLARFHTWTEQALQRLSPGSSHYDIARRFIRWHLLRRMNAMPEVSAGTYLRSKQTTTVAIDFLIWLSERGTDLPRLTQSDLDEWRATGPSTRELISRFLSWAIKSRLVHPELTTPPHRRGTSAILPASAQHSTVQRVVHTNELSARDRAAAILVLVFGQQIEDVVRLTRDHLTETAGDLTIRLGATPIILQPPLDGPLRELLAHPSNAQTAAHPASPWIFRGYRPGQHLNAMSLRERLRASLFSTRAARLGTLQELSKLAPVAIIADTLGYTPATIERHSTGSAAAYTRYVSTIATDRPHA